MMSLGNDQLKIIAHELLKGLKANVSIDWAHRDSVRARLRALVKRILRKLGYPPDLEGAAVRGVLAQAEALLSEITGWRRSCYNQRTKALAAPVLDPEIWRTEDFNDGTFRLAFSPRHPVKGS